MSAGFTPGPWMRDGISVTVERPAGEKRQCIAITSPHTDLPSINSCERMKANARLIAAAPDLYEALDETHKLISAFAISGFTDHDTGEQLYRNQGRVNAALAKARGEA